MYQASALSLSILYHDFVICQRKLLQSKAKNLMNILICDDNKKEAAELSNLIFASGFSAAARIFLDGKEVLEYIKTGALVEICFLDIIMPEIDGIKLAGLLRESGYEGKIVFLTTSNDFAHQSYRVNAFDYLLKPPSQKSVEEILKALKHDVENTDNEGIAIKTQGVARFLKFREISYAEVINHTVYIRMINGTEIAVNVTFAEVAEQLMRDNRFVKCHRSYIVNISNIETITDKELIMRLGAKIPISRGYSQVRHEMLKWMFGEKG